MRLSIDGELAVMQGLVGVLLDWHNPNLWNTAPDDPSRGIEKWKASIADLLERIAKMPPSPGRDAATTAVTMLQLAMPTEAGPVAAENLSRESTKARLAACINLLAKAESIVESEARSKNPPIQKPKKKQRVLTKSALAGKLGVPVSTFREKTREIIKRGTGQHTKPVTPAELASLYQAEVLDPDKQLILKRLLTERGIMRDGKIKAQKSSA